MSKNNTANGFGGKRLYVVTMDDLYKGKYANDERSADELTDDEVKALAGNWHFDSIEEFIEAFNTDANNCPVPSEHYLRLIEDGGAKDTDRNTAGRIKRDAILLVSTILKRHLDDEPDFLFEGSTPVVHEDPYDDNNTFTLDRVSLDDGKVFVDSSSCCESASQNIADLDLETILNIKDWLRDNEDFIWERTCSNKTRTYFQPMLHSRHDSDPDNWWLPNELASFKAFKSEEEAKKYVEKHRYSNYEIRIDEYHDDDIEGVTIIDSEGNIIETNEKD